MYPVPDLQDHHIEVDMPPSRPTLPLPLRRKLLYPHDRIITTPNRTREDIVVIAHMMLQEGAILHDTRKPGPRQLRGGLQLRMLVREPRHGNILVRRLRMQHRPGSQKLEIPLAPSKIDSLHRKRHQLQRPILV